MGSLIVISQTKLLPELISHSSLIIRTKPDFNGTFPMQHFGGRIG
jgi:hypothetical protein